MKMEHLFGVSIAVKGNSLVFTSGEGGNYKVFNMPTKGEPLTLVFASIGYATQEATLAPNDTTLNISLTTAAKDLDEVVVIGYGTQNKKDITGSVAVISAKEISSLPVGGVDQVMQGKAAGVAITQSTGAPGAGISVQIRGVGTVNNNDPLYVIDGIPTQDGINQIAPNDIESISILKDAASASIYGARASNGVVLVTLKKGVVGKAHVSANIYTGIQTPSRLIKMANTPQYIQAFNTALYADSVQSVILGTSLPTRSRIDAAPNSLPNTNWLNATLKPAPMTSVQVAVSGGSEHTRYILSATYFTQQGLIMNSRYDRFNLHTAINSTLSKWFKVGNNVNLSYSRTKSVGSSGDGFTGAPPSVVRYALFEAPINPVFDETNGNYFRPAPGQEQTWRGDGMNPVGIAANTNNYTDKYALLGDVYLELTPIKNLSIKTAIGTNFYISPYKEFYPTYVMSDNGVYSFTANNPNSLSQRYQNNFNYNWTNTANYNIDIGNNHIAVLAGTEAIYNDAQGMSASRQQYVNQSSNFQYLDNGLGTQLNGGNESTWSLFSLFGRVNYSYDDKYLFSFNARRDGSSRLDPNNQYGNFFSGSVGWRLDKENFMKNVEKISMLKVRASLGQLGNQNIGNYAYASTISGGLWYPFGSGGTPTQGYTLNAKGNPDVRWETSTQADVGVDLGLLRDMIVFNVDFYNKVTSNMLLSVPQPTSAGGAGSPTENAGQVLNRGLELNLTFQKQFNKDWRLQVNGNMAIIHNEVLSLAGGTPLSGGRVDNGANATITTVGQPIGAFYMYQMEGIFQTPLDVYTHAYQGNNLQPGDVKFKDVNGDGVIHSDDKVYAGSPIPKFTYGFTTNISCKQFDLSLFFQGVQGNKIYNQVLTDIEGFYRPFNITDRAATTSWHGEGTSNTMPRLSWLGAQNNKQMSTRFLENGSYLRLKNVQLSYTLHRAVVKALKITSARVYVSAQNLITFTQYTGLDPELGTGANEAGDGVRGVGIDWGTYPSARTYTVGVALNF